MNNWKVGARIRFGFGLTLAVLIVLGVLSYMKMTQVRTHANAIIEDSVPGVYYAGQLQYLTSYRFSVLLRHIASNDKAEIRRLEAEFKELDETVSSRLKEYEVTIRQPAEKELFAQLTRARSAYATTLDQVLAA